MSEDNPAEPRYGTVLFKLSGELLGGPDGFGFDAEVLDRVAGELGAVAAAGVKTAVVIGGGNFFRGGRSQGYAISNVRAHQMGMLFTVANALALEQTLLSKGSRAVVQSAVAIPSIVAQFDGVSFVEHLASGAIVIFAGGTGATHFSTDTAAGLRAIEMGADVLLKATNVEGIFDRDPALYSDAQYYDSLGYDEVLAKNLSVMDATAIALCRGHRLPIRVFDGTQPGRILEAGLGGNSGTLVTTEE